MDDLSKRARDVHQKLEALSRQYLAGLRDIGPNEAQRERIVQEGGEPAAWVPVSKVAEMIGHTSQKTRSLLAAEEVPVRKFGKTPMIKREDAEEFVQKPGVVERDGKDLETFDKIGQGRSRQAQSKASRNSDPA